MAATPTYTLPKLPYAYDALEPAVSSQIMTLHHQKHHQAYITNLNAALSASVSATQQGNLVEAASYLSAIRFNGGGHINHSLFWEGLAPPGSPETDARTAAPELVKAIEEAWGEGSGGGLDGFWADFAKALLGIQGSGWGWLVREGGGADGKSATKKKRTLRIVTLANQEAVVETSTAVPLLGVDMWEHAYYLQYLNGKAAYVDNIWAVINWKTAEARFLGEREDVFAGLRANL
ncbi:manganese superoxide dismutase [Microdochium trichocladiopsis]|uniref:Superoxide dismutase n=1 Tax=Microdochium trichocladiopsis TaxID=1682393 RepID=A0A9P8YCJ2_9PEZI|nr:manganese superoxide dismutase [Microdochium trichocladiopsis]KAH7038251.1 manganese superoxide dismutase [Microdochium trichocladiopsis]